MKTLRIGLLAIAISTRVATAQASDQQTTVTVQRPPAASMGPQKHQLREEVAFEFEKAHTLLENSRSSKTPTTLTLPLGNNETAEITVQGKTNHIGQIVWKDGQFVPIEHPYLSFEGTTKDGGRVRGFISEQSFSAIVHSPKNGRILVQSKSLQVGSDMTNAPPAALVDDVIESPMKKLLSPITPGNLSSPVDAGGFVQLRHLGLLITLTDRRYHAINGNVTDWVTSVAQQIDDVLKSQLGVTVDPIGSTPESGGVQYIVQPTGGYPGQPAYSIFSDPSVPDTTQGWAIANHNFQTWVVQNAGASALWWDMGIALGGDGGVFFDDPKGGLAQAPGICDPSRRGYAYINWSSKGLSGTVHELGHLLGASHTFSSQEGGCGGYIDMASAVEPGSGSTLMSYAGVCAPDDVQAQADFYFHGRTIEQISFGLQQAEAEYAACISRKDTMNRPPVIKLRDTVPEYPWNKVPKGVRFELNAQFEDPELEDLKQLAIDNNDPAWIPTDAKNYGAGYMNFEQCNSFADIGFFPALYRSFAPRHTEALPPGMDLDYPTHYKHSFPQETNPQGSQWDPLMTTPGNLGFCITGWDNYGSPSNSFPAFAFTRTFVEVVDLPKPVFTFPQSGQTVKAWDPQQPQQNVYNVTWLPYFAGYQTQFSSITLSYKDPKKGWDDLAWEFNAPGFLNAFSAIKFPKQPYETSYTTQLRLEYKTMGDVTWFVESPPFEVQDKRIFYSGFE